MAQSLTKIYIHLIFHIKTTSPLIRKEDQERIQAYLGQLVNQMGCQVLQVGGIGDHVHLLFLLSKNESLSHVVEELKRNSSRWMSHLDAYYVRFGWQGGYAAFSVSQSIVEKTLAYIKGQEEHHKKRSFHEEYLEFLNIYGIKYDERYVFVD